MATRVLVVEDEEQTAALLRDLLREFGYEPLLVRSAEAARSALDTERPDVILLDLRLPLMSGLDFLQIDRVRAARPAVRLYFRPLDGGPGLYLLAILVRREDPDTYVFRFVNLTEAEFERLRDVVAGVGESS